MELAAREYEAAVQQQPSTTQLRASAGVTPQGRVSHNPVLGTLKACTPSAKILSRKSNVAKSASYRFEARVRVAPTAADTVPRTT